MNLDQQQLAQFAQLSTQWWDQAGPMKPLHRINPIRLAFISSWLKQPQRILDVGCGGGILSEALAQQGHHVTAIDPAGSLIAAAKQHLPAHLTVDYRAETIEQHQPSALYDAVTCMELLEHVPAPQDLIKACVAQLQSDGTLFIATLNRNLTSYLGAIIAAEYLFKLLPVGTHDYAHFIKPSELEQWLSPHHYAIRDIAGINYNPINHKAHLSSNVSVNYIVACTKSG